MKLYRKKITLTLDSVMHPSNEWLTQFLSKEVSETLAKRLGRYFVVRNVKIEESAPKKKKK